MQTILKIVCDNRSLAHLVDDFILRFCEKATSDAPTVDHSLPKADDVAFGKDDCADPERAHVEGERTNLGSFGPTQVNENTKLIFVNPLILSYRPNRHRLCVWIGGPLPEASGEMESE